MSKRDEVYFQCAKNVSLNSDFNRVKIGTVVVYKNEIISEGYNTYKTHPIQMKYDKYRTLYTFNGVSPQHCIHSEINALKRIKTLDIKWNKVKVYIYREDMNGHIANCRPCNSCMAFIKELGIRNIYYTTDNGYCYERLLNE